MDDDEIPLLLSTKPAWQLDLLVDSDALLRDLGIDQEIAHQASETVHLLAGRYRASSTAIAIDGIAVTVGLLVASLPEVAHRFAQSRLKVSHSRAPASSPSKKSRGRRRDQRLASSLSRN